MPTVQINCSCRYDMGKTQWFWLPVLFSGLGYAQNAYSKQPGVNLHFTLQAQKYEGNKLEYNIITATKGWILYVLFCSVVLNVIWAPSR